MLWGSLLWANLLEMHKTLGHGFWGKSHDFKWVLLLLTFYKENIFLEKKNQLVIFFPLPLRVETAVPWIMQKKTLSLKKKKKKKGILETTRIRFPSVQKLLERAFRKRTCEKPQVSRPYLLHFIAKILKSGFVTLQIGVPGFQGVHSSPRWVIFILLKSAKLYMLHSNLN